MAHEYNAGQRFIIQNRNSRLFNHQVLVIMSCPQLVDLYDETSESYETIKKKEFDSWVGINC